jgi:hypothetical protein
MEFNLDGEKADTFDFVNISLGHKNVFFFKSFFNDETNTLEVYQANTDIDSSYTLYFKKPFYEYVNENKRIPFKIKFKLDVPEIEEVSVRVLTSRFADNENMAIIGSDILQDLIDNNDSRVRLVIDENSSVDTLRLCNTSNRLELVYLPEKELKKLSILNAERYAALNVIVRSDMPIMLYNIFVMNMPFISASISATGSETGVINIEDLEFANTININLITNHEKIKIFDECSKIKIMSLVNSSGDIEYTGESELYIDLLNSHIGTITAKKQKLFIHSKNSSVQDIDAKQIVITSLQKHNENDYLKRQNEIKKKKNTEERKRVIIVKPTLICDFI